MDATIDKTPLGGPAPPAIMTTPAGSAGNNTTTTDGNANQGPDNPTISRESNTEQPDKQPQGQSNEQPNAQPDTQPTKQPTKGAQTDNCLNITVSNQGSHQATYRLKLTTPLGKLIQSYHTQTGRTPGTWRIFYDGVRVNASDTPASVSFLRSAGLFLWR